MYVSELAAPAVAVNAVFVALAFISASLRIITRAFIVKSVGPEDYLISIAVLGSIGFFIAVLFQVREGLGTELTLDTITGFLITLWAVSPIYYFSLAFSKASMVVQCLRIFRTSSIRIVLIVLLVFTTMYSISAFVSSLLICIPPQAYWGAAQGTCVNTGALGFANAAINICTDVAIFAIPIPQLIALKIPRKQKIILICVFACGLFTCITSMIRLRFLYVVSISPQSEQSLQAVQIAVWSGIEINMAIICASVPTLKPLTVKLFPKFLSSSGYSGPSGRAYYGRTGSGAPDGTFRGEGTAGTRIADQEAGIHVQQSIEMHTVLADGTDDSEKLSYDGSQKDLVNSAQWRADCFSVPEQTYSRSSDRKVSR